MTFSPYESGQLMAEVVQDGFKVSILGDTQNANWT